MVVPQGDHIARYYQQYSDVDLAALSTGEVVVHRAPALYRNRLLTTRSGSLILTPRRVLFLSPLHRAYRWRNCEVSMPLSVIKDLRWRRLRPAVLFTFSQQICIDVASGHRTYFSISDALEWCGAIQHQCQLAGHSIAS